MSMTRIDKDLIQPAGGWGRGQVTHPEHTVLPEEPLHLPQAPACI